MPDVSVIIPVFNVKDYLEECVRSILDQDLQDTTLEVIAVDDGSTDGSGEILDRLAASDPRLVVIHQANSGWPGQPRNRGIEVANGRYLFFCDADDLVPTESLRRLVSFADRQRSDVVIPKVIGGNGRWIRRWLYEESQIDADLYKAFQTHGPQKLFRRSMVMDHAIRFPEHKMRIEDAMFGFSCYVVADRVSILADYDYYILQNRDDGSNISRRGLDPEEYTRDSFEVASVVHNGLPADGLRDRIMAELFRRLCLRRYVGSSFAKASEERQRAWISGHQKFIAAFVPPAVEDLLDPVNRQRSRLIRAGRRSDLVVVANSTADDALSAQMSGVEPTGTGCRISGVLSMQHQFRRFAGATLELRRRGQDDQIAFNIRPKDLISRSGDDDLPDAVVFAVDLSHAELAHYPRGVYDLSLKSVVDGKPLTTRLRAPDGDYVVTYPADDVVHFYSTKHGNISCKF
ncbi:glycosyltransferase family 2 protein [Arthrobacter sp. CP30]